MPLDPLISLGVQMPKFNSPFEMLGQAMQLRNQQLQGQAQQLEIEKLRAEAQARKKTQDDIEALNALIQANPDRTKLLEAVRLNAPGSFAAVQKTFADLDEKAALANEHVQGAKSAQAAAAGKIQDFFSSLGSAIEAHGNSPLALKAAGDLAIATFPDAPEVAKQVQQAYQQVLDGTPIATISKGLMSLNAGMQKQANEAPGQIAGAAMQGKINAGMSPTGMTAEQQSQAANQEAQRKIAQQNADTASAREGREATAAQASQPVEIKDGTPEFKVAQDLAYGRLTSQQFRSLVAYSRNTGQKMGIYAKAAELNPNFNPAQFEMGFKLASNPKVQQQLASLDNVQRGVPDLLKFSDAAARTKMPFVNRFVVPGGVAIGNKKYSNLQTAVTAFADELSGALGYGSATDMSREMGFNMTDKNLSPEQFTSAIQDVVVPFVARKRSTLLDQMGVYGQPGMNPAASLGGSGQPAPAATPSAPKIVTAAQVASVAKKNGTTIQQETARAVAEGYVVR